MSEIFKSIVPSMTPKFLKKLNLLVNQCTRAKKEMDAVLIIEGREGTGKTLSSVFAAGYVRMHTRISINLMFNLEKVIDFAKRTSGQIIIWDEPALDALSTDNLNRLNRDLQRLLMTCRAKRHFFIINIVDFTKFSKYITVERPHAFVHLQKGRVGHGCYIRYNRLERMRLLWDVQKKRKYNKFRSFYLDFPYISPEVFDSLDMTINGIPHATYAIYLQQKNMAIESIGEKDSAKDKYKAENRKLKKLIGTEPKGLKSQEERAAHYKVNVRQLQRWAKLGENDEIDWDIGDRSDFEAGGDSNIVIQGEDGEKIEE
jgi:hypothetical protein